MELGFTVANKGRGSERSNELGTSVCLPNREFNGDGAILRRGSVSFACDQQFRKYKIILCLSKRPSHITARLRKTHPRERVAVPLLPGCVRRPNPSAA